jgi:hypothetical protein
MGKFGKPPTCRINKVSLVQLFSFSLNSDSAPQIPIGHRVNDGDSIEELNINTDVGLVASMQCVEFGTRMGSGD